MLRCTSVSVQSRFAHRSTIDHLEGRKLLAAAPPADLDISPPESNDFVKDRYTISFDPEVIGEFRSRLGRSILDVVRETAAATRGLITQSKGLGFASERFVSISTRVGATFDEVREAVSLLPGFVDLVRIPLATTSAVPNDTNYATQWYLEQATDRDIDYNAATDRGSQDRDVDS